MSSGIPNSGTARSSSGYQSAVLKIRTPVAVTLAKRKVSLQSILDLVPGSMLTFDTHCDEPLLLEIGDHSIARGETVKIGDKFGLRIREILGEPDDT
jgi:flagellar motor switch protein FliN/FliY